VRRQCVPAGVQSGRRRRLLPRGGRGLGDPARLLSDNGAVYTGRYRGVGRVALELTLNARGIAFAHSRPYHPQTYGKVERFHKTQKALAQQPAPFTIADQPAATARRVPPLLQPPSASPGPGPTHTPGGLRRPTTGHALRYPLDDAYYRVRHDTVDACGKLTLRHGSRLHHIGIGRHHRHRPVLILVKDLHVRITTANGELLRDLQLDPSRDYQPQPKT
jgi:hypothetical protein